MTKRRKPNTRCQQETTGEKPLPPSSTTQRLTTEDELERQMRNALADVYEVLGYASDEREAVEWSQLELVNDLVH